jgi:hypothetical protein
VIVLKGKFKGHAIGDDGRKKGARRACAEDLVIFSCSAATCALLISSSIPFTLHVDDILLFFHVQRKNRAVEVTARAPDEQMFILVDMPPHGCEVGR